MTSQPIQAQVSLPTELYQSLQKRAKQQGDSLNYEIVTLLISSLATETERLAEEFKLWEMAIDEDWSSFESVLTIKA